MACRQKYPWNTCVSVKSGVTAFLINTYSFYIYQVFFCKVLPIKLIILSTNVQDNVSIPCNLNKMIKLTIFKLLVIEGGKNSKSGETVIDKRPLAIYNFTWKTQLKIFCQ